MGEKNAYRVLVGSSEEATRRIILKYTSEK
jgi:hypothetical protein